MKRSVGGVARGFRTPRGARARRHDPYRVDGKLAGAAYCGKCAATYQRGRWSWKPKTATARAQVCPACRRIQEGQPAGVLRITQELAARPEELLHLIHNVEHHERLEHPLERVMSMAVSGKTLVVQTTGIRIAQRIADAISRAFHCEVDSDFLNDQELVRIRLAPRAAR